MIATPLRYLQNTPFLRYLLFFSAGVAAYLLGLSVMALSLTLCLTALCVWFLFRKFPFSTNTLVLLFTHLGLSYMAFVLCAYKEQSTLPDFILKNKNTKAYKAYISHKSSDDRYELSILASYDQTWKKASGSSLLTVKGDKAFNIYDTLYIKGCPSYIKKPLNPEEFDYQNYYYSKGILLQDYIKDSQIIQQGTYTGVSLKMMAYELRTFFSSRIRLYLSDPNVAAIAEALILGIRSEISSELIKAYAQTGTVHVLAVSGMHIGILFGTIVWIFSSLFGSNHKIKYSIAALLFMWFFALITGFSASVLRAAVMYSVYQIGVMTQRKVDLPNTLFSSAFIILLFQPLMLLDVGFQLSFFAVLGIITIQPFFQKVWDTYHPILKNLRDLMTVSIAAQLGVLPLSLMYFKQFPNLFIISNLLEVFLSTLALYVGLLCMVFMTWDFALLYLCKILSFLIELMNLVALKLSALPFAITKLYLYSWEAWCIGFVILYLAMFLRWKKIKFLKIATMCVAVLITMFYGRYYYLARTEMTIIYANHKDQVIDVYKNGALLRIFCSSDSDILVNLKLMQTLSNNQLKNTFNDQATLLRLKGKRSLYYKVNKKAIQVLNDPKAKLHEHADIFYINYSDEPQQIPVHSLVVVQRHKTAEKLRQKGYQNIHCLETQGALYI